MTIAIDPGDLTLVAPVRHRRRRRILAAAAAVVAVLVAVPLYFHWQSQRAIDKLLAAARARGEPLTAAELADLYVQPPLDQDCTPLYLIHEATWSSRFGKASSKFPIIDRQIPPPRLDESWDELPAVEDFLHNARADLENWHVAATRGGRARFPVSFDQGFMTLLPYAQAMRGIARILALEAHVRAYYDDPAGAAASPRAAIAAGRALENEPVAVSQLVRMACHGLAVNELMLLLPQLDFSADDLARLQADLEATDFRPGVRAGIIGDRVMGIISADDPSKMGYNRRLHTIVHYASRKQLLRRFLEECERLSDVVEKPWHEVLVEFPISQDATAPRFFDWNPVMEFVGGTSGYLRSAARATAINKLGILSLALARYRLDHGELPTDLAALMPDYISEVPLDPMTGDAFIYSNDERGMILKSTWQDANSKIDPETGADRDLQFRWPADNK